MKKLLIILSLLYANICLGQEVSLTNSTNPNGEIQFGVTYTKSQIESILGMPTKYETRDYADGVAGKYEHFYYGENHLKFINGKLKSFSIRTNQFKILNSSSDDRNNSVSGIKVGDVMPNDWTLDSRGRGYLYYVGQDEDPIIAKPETQNIPGIIGMLGTVGVINLRPIIAALIYSESV
jgi:hypothetical protein